jgi:transcriptional regulator with XRE-family HTH domain
MASLLGVTLPGYIHKEEGSNIITAMELFTIAKTLKVTIGSFFQPSIKGKRYKYDVDNTTIGINLSDLRANTNMTLAQLSALCGISRQALSRWERGEVSMSALSLNKLAVVYGVDIDQLYEPIKKKVSLRRIADSSPLNYKAYLYMDISGVGDPYIWREYLHGDSRFIIYGLWKGKDVILHLLEVNEELKQLMKKTSKLIIKEDLLFTSLDKIIKELITGYDPISNVNNFCAPLGTNEQLDNLSLHTKSPGNSKEQDGQNIQNTQNSPNTINTQKSQCSEPKVRVRETYREISKVSHRKDRIGSK